MTASASSLAGRLRALSLPVFALHHETTADQAERGGWGFAAYLGHLTDLELEQRRRRRIERLRKESHLPAEKTLACLELAKLPAPVRRALPSLCEGGFVDRGENLLAFGLPGRGKTHLLCAVGHELVLRGYRVLFTPAYRLVQRLLVAKRALALETALRRLDGFDAVLLDDIGYIQQDREEMEVLFAFLAERYERKSVLITSNLVFSQWDQIFKDPLTTAAAIDRLVHHSVILELTGTSYRSDEALQRQGRTPTPERPAAPRPVEAAGAAENAPAIASLSEPPSLGVSRRSLDGAKRRPQLPPARRAKKGMKRKAARRSGGSSSATSTNAQG